MSENEEVVKIVYSIEDKVSGALKKIEENFKKVNETIEKPKSSKKQPFDDTTKSIFNLNNLIKGFAIQKVASIGKELTTFILNAASDMEELQNVTDQVFENLSADVENYAKTMGVAMGRSTYSMKKYVSDMGAVLKGFGDFDNDKILEISTSLSSLAVDIGSFKNVSDEEAFNALRSGIVGETESLKRLGIVINDTVMSEYARNKGIKESWQTLNAAVKAELRYQAIMEKTTFMQGDAARTIDSYANQLKVFGANINNLAVTIGQKFQSSATGFLKSVNEMLSATNDFLNKKSVEDYYLEFVTQSNAANEKIKRYVELCKESNANQLSNDGEKERLELFEELKRTYPSIFNNLSNEVKHYNSVANAIHEVNKQLSAKIHNQMIDDSVVELTKQKKELDFKVANTTKEINDIINKSIKENRNLNGLKITNVNQLEKAKEISMLSNAYGYHSPEIVKNFAIKGRKFLEELGINDKNYRDDQIVEIVDDLDVIYGKIKKGLSDIDKIEKQVSNKSKEISQNVETYNLLSNDFENTDISEIHKSIFKKYKNTSNFYDTAIAELNNKKIKLDLPTVKEVTTTKTQSKEEKTYFGSLYENLTKLKTQLNESAKHYSPMILSASNDILEKNLTQLDKIKSTMSEKDFVSGQIKAYETAQSQIVELAKRGDANALNKLEEYKNKIKELKDQETQILNTEKFNEYKEKLEESIKGNKTNKDFNVEQIKQINTKIEEIYKEISKNILVDGKVNTSLKENQTKLEELEKAQKEWIANNGEKNKSIEDHIDLLKTLINVETYKKETHLEDMLDQLRTIEEPIKEITKEEQEIERLKKEFNENIQEFQNYFLNLPEELQKVANESKNIEEFIAKLEDYENVADEVVAKRAELLRKSSSKALETKLKIQEKQAEQDENNKRKELAKKINDIYGSFLDFFVNELKGIASKISDDAIRDVMNSIVDTLNLFGTFAKDLATAIISEGDPESVAKAVQSGLKILTTLIGGLISYFDDTQKKLSIEKFDKREKGVYSSNLKALLDLNSSIRELNNTLIKQASQNTSNKNLDKLEKLNRDLVENYSNSFNTKIIANGVKERDLKIIGNNGKFSFMMLPIIGHLVGLFSSFVKLGVHKESSIELNKNFMEIFNLTAKNSKELREFYDNTLSKMTDRDLNQYYDGYDKNKTSSSERGDLSITYDYTTTKSNIEDVKAQFLEHIKKVEEMEKAVASFKTNTILESFDGISVVAVEDYKKQVLGMYEKIYQGRDDKEELLKKVIEKLDEEIKTDQVAVTAFDDVRNTTIENLKNGNNMLDSLANGLSSYFEKIKTNLAKVKYDGVFRELEEEFSQTFEGISRKLTDYRLSGGTDIKKFASENIDFKTLFGKVKLVENINNDLKDVVTMLREQAKAQGLSEEYINMMFPLDDIKDKIFDVKTSLSNAMAQALNTNSFNQFSMSLGESLYNSVKTSLIQAFSESEAYKTLFDKYINTEEYKRQLEESKSFKDAYNILQDQLKRTEDMLAANGLGFKSTSANNGEYLGGFMASNGEYSRNSVQGVSQGINISLNIENKGYLSTDDLTESLAKTIKEKIYFDKEREIYD